MNYFFIALLTTSVTAIVLYFLLNKILHIKIRIIPLVLCVACSLFISITLPKVILRYTDWLGTLAVLSIFSVIAAYLLAYYEGNLAGQQADSESQICFNEPVTRHDNLSAPIFMTDSDVHSSQKITPETVNYPSAADASPQICYAEAQSLHDTEINTLDSFSVPNTLEKQLELAFHLKEQQEFSAAAILFQNILKENPNSEATALLILHIADSLKNAKEYQQAIDILTKCFDLSAAYDIEIERQLYELLTKLQHLQNAENTGGF